MFGTLTSQTMLGCCRQPCHQQCVNQWKNARHTISCPHCRQITPIVVLDYKYNESWKKEEIFAREVKQVWKDNDLWFGARYDGYECKTGFWGELKDAYEPNKKNSVFSWSYQKSRDSTHEHLFEFFVNRAFKVGLWTPVMGPLEPKRHAATLYIAIWTLDSKKWDAADHSGPGTRSHL